MNPIKNLFTRMPGLRASVFVLATLCAANIATANPSDYFTTSIANNTTYYWDLPNWSTSATGPFTSSWQTTNFARFTGGAGDTYTVVVSNTESIGGMYMTTATGTLILTNAPGGNLNIVTIGSTATTQNGFTWKGQGFLTAGGNFEIYAPLTGPAGVSESSGGGHLELLGTNTYSGGTIWTSSATFVDYNNNSSFGTGQLGFNGTTFSIVENAGPAGVTITNGLQTIGTCGINFIGNASTFSGNWYLGGAANNINIRNNGVGTTLTLGGVLSSTTGTVNYSGANAGVILLTNKNTYTGPTSVGVSGDSSITLEIGATGSLASTVITNFGTGSIIQLDGPNCLKTNATLGLPASPANNSVNLNFTGTNSIAAIIVGGVVQPGGTWGAPGSTAQNQVSYFTGNGVLSTPAAPSILIQPQSVAVFEGGTATFGVVGSGAQPLNYQWYSNNVALSGQNGSTYTISPADFTDAANYSVNISNVAGSTNSASVSLTVLPTNSYTSQIINNAGLGLISYWRLDETNGTIAHDDFSTNNGVYVNVSLGQPGFSVADPDTCIGLPANTNSRGFVVVSNYAPFNFTSKANPFTIECWANFTNLTGVQRIVSTLGNGNGYAFGINGPTGMRFTQGAIQDADLTLTNALQPGVWYQFVVSCDGANYNYYLDGVRVGTVAVSGAGNGVIEPLQFGANPSVYPYAEQVYGNIDEVSIYNSYLVDSQVLADYNARPLPSLPVVGTPIASAPTNYVSLTTTIQVAATGQGTLSYQWFMSPSTELNGETNATLVLSPLQMSDAGSYYVMVSNQGGSTNSTSVAIAVLPIPTNYTQLNLTNGLVIHLPFDGGYGDASGRGNNGTNVGATTFVSGIIGSNALHYSSDTNAQSYNYVTLGTRPDLQFSSNINFSVSYWVRQDAGSDYTNLPFFADEIGSTLATNTGFAFAPYAGQGGGGWQWSLNLSSSPNQYTSFPDAGLINDGNWHNLVHVADRSANLTTYLDGVQVDSQSIVFITTLNTTNRANIGQDPTGIYPATASADIDDLGVWTRMLSPLEVSGIYLAGVSNAPGVSFASSTVVTGPTYVTLTVQSVGSNIQLSWPGGSGNLQGSANAAGPYTNIVGASSPYTVPTTSSQQFYRLHP